VGMPVSVAITQVVLPGHLVAHGTGLQCSQFPSLDCQLGMAGYRVLAFCACARQNAARMSNNPKPLTAFVPRSWRIFGPSERDLMIPAVRRNSTRERRKKFLRPSDLYLFGLDGFPRQD